MAGPAKKPGALKHKASSEAVGAAPKKAKALNTSPPLSPHATPPTPAMRALSLQPSERSTPAYTAPAAATSSSPAAATSVDSAAVPATTTVAIADIAHSVAPAANYAAKSTPNLPLQRFIYSIPINGGNFILVENNEGEAMSTCLDFEPLSSHYRSDTSESESEDVIDIDEQDDQVSWVFFGVYLRFSWVDWYANAGAIGFALVLVGLDR
ncbi:hypothetical protein OCU04_005813 [Sclerotinia nivalis]|uniref:Uncharacterized protein n=1 Tax=Sclerotinia nivalis TaxID=352851 RepID=A0A9X0DJX1_9HELO|nr:hypothetical protein OCU04_005813 [Sclerotinia nivalis]